MGSSYVYVFEIDGVVRYVGMGGTHNRISEHLRVIRNRKAARQSGEAVRPHRWYDNLEAAIDRGATIVTRKIVEGLTRTQALHRESSEIASRCQLWNSVYRYRPRMADAEVRLRHLIGTTEAQNRPEVRAANRARAVAMHASPEYKARHRAAVRAALMRPEVRAKLSAAGKKKLSDPDAAARNRLQLRSLSSDPNVERKRLDGFRAAMADPAHKEAKYIKIKSALAAARPRKSESAKAAWADPVKRANILAGRAKLTRTRKKT